MSYQGRFLAAAAALLLARCGSGVAATVSSTSADYQRGYSVGLQAYVYGLPLLVTDAAKIPADHDWTLYLNPQSLERLTDCLVEPSLKTAEVGTRLQFERTGYFCVDPDTTPGKPVFNRTVSLKDAWAKIDKAPKGH